MGKHRHLDAGTENFIPLLLKLVFINSESEPCLYIRISEDAKNNIHLLLYVNDIIISRKNFEVLKNIKNVLKLNFKMTDKENLTYYLSIHIEKKRDEIALS